ncbi:hypothetical protein Nmel_015131, partial [Mimus melanotis]
GPVTPGPGRAGLGAKGTRGRHRPLRRPSRKYGGSGLWAALRSGRGSRGPTQPCRPSAPPSPPCPGAAGRGPRCPMTSARSHVADDVTTSPRWAGRGRRRGVTSRAGGAVPRARPGPARPGRFCKRFHKGFIRA